MKDNRTLYEKNVQDRNLLHYLIGLYRTMETKLQICTCKKNRT